MDPIRRVVRVAIVAACGTAVLASVCAQVSGVPGAGPEGSLAAAQWAPFARAGYLVGWPLALLAAMAQGGLFVAGRLRRDERELAVPDADAPVDATDSAVDLLAADATLTLLQLGLLMAMTVGASALFTVHNGLDLAALAAGPDPGLLLWLGTPARVVLSVVPPVLLHAGALLFGVFGAGATVAGLGDAGARTRLRGLGRALDGIAMGAVLVWWVSGGTALGGAMQAGSSQRRLLLLVAGGCAAIGLATERLARRGGGAGGRPVNGAEARP